ncbi:MAG TPA: hypothetical protein VNQ73_20830 [Ilumatobacter sp.]|nr:hypothetical protein [Ilumatobacter sp.]
MSRPAVDSFGLALPPEWVCLPLDAPAFERFARQQRRTLADRGELSRPAQRRHELVIRQLRNDCVRQGVTLAAVFATPLDAGAGQAPDLLAATCTLSTLTQTGLATDLPLTVHTILAATSRTDRGDTADIADLEPPAAVDLPGGPAVKLVRMHRVGGDNADGTSGVRLLAEHFLVPYDQGRRAAALTFATPNIEFAGPLRALFDELANTLRLFAGDDPTDPTPPVGGDAA